MFQALLLAAVVGWSGLEPDNHLGGRKVSEGYLQGKVVMVCRWSATSSESHETLSRLEQVWMAHKTKPFVLLGSLQSGANDRAKAKAKALAGRKGLSFSLYEGGGLSKDEPPFSAPVSFYVVDATGKVIYKGKDERIAEESLVSALTNLASPPDAAYWKRLIDSEIDVLPGRAYLHISEFRKRFPEEASDHDDQFKALKARSEVVKLAQLEAFSASAKNFDPSSDPAKLREMLAKLKATSKKYDVFKGHSDSTIAQEAKNCLADLKWAEIALKSQLDD